MNKYSYKDDGMYKTFEEKWNEQKMMHLPDGRRTRMTGKSPHIP